MALSASLSQLAAGLQLAARQRLELAALDVEEQVIRLGSLLAMAFAATLLAALALAAAAAAVVVAFWDSARIPALLGVTLVFAAGCAAMLWQIARAWRAKPAFLAATLSSLQPPDKEQA